MNRSMTLKDISPEFSHEERSCLLDNMPVDLAITALFRAACSLDACRASVALQALDKVKNAVQAERAWLEMATENGVTVGDFARDAKDPHDLTT